MQQYDNLYNLIRESPEAYRYFHSLPEHVRESIGQRAQSISSVESLRDYAENLTRDDE